MNEHRVARAIRQEQAPRSFFQAVVTAHTSGPPSSLTIKIQGSTVAVAGVRYLAGYSPTNGDVVWGFWNGRDAIVMGILAP